MNLLIEAFSWSMLQVTLFATLAGAAYFVARWLRAARLAEFLTVSLLLVGLLTAGILSPWPSWNGPSTALLNEPPILSAKSNEPSIDDEQFSTASSHFASLESTNNVSVSRSSEQKRVEADTSLSEKTESQINYRSVSQIWALIVWLALIVSAVGLVRLLVGARHIRRCRRQSAPLPEGDLTQLLRSLCEELNVSRVVELRESTLLTVPATIGWHRPIVLVPPSWMEWSSDEQRAVLAHELAHIRQRHFPAWIASQIAAVTHFYHPLVQMLSRRLRLEMELSADALAATVFPNRRQYAAALAGLALGPSRSPALIAPLGLFMSRPLLMRRIAMLRQSNEQAPGSSRWKSAMVFVALILAAVGAAGLRAATDDDTGLPAFSDPARTTRVIATLKVAREVESMATGESQTMSDAAWKTFCNSQIAMLKSDWLLQNALRDPTIANLSILGSPRRSRSWLQKNLRVGFVGESEFLYVLLYCKPSEADEAQARQIVDATVKTYLAEVKYRNNVRHEVPILTLTRRLDALDKDIARKMEDYLDMAKQLGSAQAEGGNNVSQQILLNQIERIESELMRLENEKYKELANAKPDNAELSKKNFELLGARREDLERRRDKLMQELHTSGEESVDLTRAKSELDQLQQITRDMRTRLNALEIDRSAPPRIEQIHPAITTDAAETAAAATK